MTFALGATTLVFLGFAALMLVVVLLLSRQSGGGWRFRSRDVAQPTPNRNGDAVRAHDERGSDPLTPRIDQETPQREVRY